MRVRRVRRNPLSLGRSAGKITSALMPAAIGAGGALALNLGWQKFAASLPASIQTGIGATAAQIALSMLLGVGAGMAFGKNVGNQVAAGAITVTIFGLAQSYMNGTAGTGTGIGASNASYNGAGAYYGASGVAGLGLRHRRGMNRYVGPQMNGAPPRGLNRYVGPQMNGAPPRGLNGLAAVGFRSNLAPGPRRRGMHGYMSPARQVGF